MRPVCPVPYRFPEIFCADPVRYEYENLLFCPLCRHWIHIFLRQQYTRRNCPTQAVSACLARRRRRRKNIPQPGRQEISPASSAGNYRRVGRSRVHFGEGSAGFAGTKKGRRNPAALELLRRKAIAIAVTMRRDRRPASLAALLQTPDTPGVATPFSNISVDTRSPPLCC